MRSSSKSSTASKPAAAAALSLSSREPPRETVAIELSMRRRRLAVAPDQRGEVLQHPVGVRLATGEDLERADGLEHRHPSAIEPSAASAAGLGEELGLQRPVD